MLTLQRSFVIIGLLSLNSTQATSLTSNASCPSNQTTPLSNKTQLETGHSLSQLALSYPGISYNQFIKAIQPKKFSTIISQLKVGQTIISEQNPQNCDLQALKILLDNHREIRIIKLTDGSFKSFIFNSPKYVREVYKHFYIDSSFYTDGMAKGIPYNIISKVEFALASRFDFSRALRRGDHFALMYEEKFNNQHEVSNGRLLKIVYTRTNGQITSLYRYITTKSDVLYADEFGRNSESHFLRNPLRSARVSSHFNLKRLHPILHKIKAHKGTDFAAPLNTPVRTTADGEVAFIGKLRAYGNTIRIKHGKTHQTLYAHLSKFAKDLRLGNLVERGQTIGYVGQTGLATGPHLHYEFIVNNKHQDPMRVQLPLSKLDKVEIVHFRRHQQRYLRKFKQLRDINLLAKKE